MGAFAQAGGWGGATAYAGGGMARAYAGGGYRGGCMPTYRPMIYQRPFIQQQYSGLGCGTRGGGYNGGTNIYDSFNTYNNTYNNYGFGNDGGCGYDTGCNPARKYKRRRKTGGCPDTGVRRRRKIRTDRDDRRIIINNNNTNGNNTNTNNNTGNGGGHVTNNYHYYSNTTNNNCCPEKPPCIPCEENKPTGKGGKIITGGDVAYKLYDATASVDIDSLFERGWQVTSGDPANPNAVDPALVHRVGKTTKLIELGKKDGAGVSPLSLSGTETGSSTGTVWSTLAGKIDGKAFAWNVGSAPTLDGAPITAGTTNFDITYTGGLLTITDKEDKSSITIKQGPINLVSGATVQGFNMILDDKDHKDTDNGMLNAAIKADIEDTRSGNPYRTGYKDTPLVPLDCLWDWVDSNISRY